MKPITENTTLSIGLMIVILGGAGFVTYTAFQSDANAKAVEKLDAKVEAVIEMKADIAVIRAKVERIEKALEKEK